MKRFPLYFRFDEMVLGNGYAARVRFDGQVTAELDEGEVWLYGVHPGGAADTGADLVSAFAAYRVRLKLVLIDFATDAPTFKAFKAEVERFFHECDPESEAEWIEARRQIRAGLASADPTLPRVTDDRVPRVQVTLLALQPEQNVAGMDSGSPQVAA